MGRQCKIRGARFAQTQSLIHLVERTALSAAVAAALYYPHFAVCAQPTEPAGVDTMRGAGVIKFDIPPQDLNSALLRFADQSGIQLFYEAATLKGIQSPGVRGVYNPNIALNRLLDKTGFTFSSIDANSVRIGKPDAGDATLLPTITVVEDLLVDEGFKADYQTTATKTPLPIRETPQAVSVITRDSIETRLAGEVSTALELAAGVTPGGGAGAGPFSGTSRDNGEAFLLRGQRLDSSRDVRIDGFAGSSFGIAPDIALFERVEVIKGPSSSLYGTGSLGGFINRVTKKPQAERIASGAGQVGSFDTYRPEFDVTGALDADADYRARLIGVYEDAGSFVDDSDREVKLIAPMFAANLGDRTRLLLQSYFQELGGTPNFGVPALLGVDGKLSTPPNIRRRLYPGVAGNSNMDNDEYTRRSWSTSSRIAGWPA